MVQAAKLTPGSWQGAVISIVTSQHALVIGETAVLRMSPTGTRGVGKRNLSHDPRMHAVFTVELDGSPVNKVVGRVITRARLPTRGDSQRIGVEHHPMTTPRDPTGTWIQTHGDAFVGEVVLFAGDLVSVNQAGTIIHRRPSLDVTGLRTPRISCGQAGQISVIDLGILTGVVRPQVGLPDVVDDIVLLRGNHPGLRGHLPKTVCQRAVHSQGVAAVFELALRKP